MEQEIKQLEERIANKKNEIQVQKSLLNQFIWKEENSIAVCDVLLNGVEYRASLSADKRKLILHGGHGQERVDLSEGIGPDDMLRRLGFSARKY